MTALEPREAGAFMQRWGAQTVEAHGPPRAVLAVSAHSLAHEPVLLAAPRHVAVYDFGGFDNRLYALRYDAPGAPELAERAAALLQRAGLPVRLSNDGGLDHGIWTPLRYVLPAANVPVLPLAWPPGWPPQRKQLLRRVFAGGLRTDIDRPATPESSAFRDWWAGQSAAANWAALFNYRDEAPHARLMHPTDEHLLPFFVAAGAAGGGPAERVHASLTYGDLGMDAYRFAPTA
jgi:4,5-DOPA dioxygenase extradiol